MIVCCLWYIDVNPGEMKGTRSRWESSNVWLCFIWPRYGLHNACSKTFDGRASTYYVENHIANFPSSVVTLTPQQLLVSLPFLWRFFVCDKIRMVHSIRGWQVKLCDPSNTFHSWALLVVVYDDALYKSTFTLLTLHHPLITFVPIKVGVKFVIAAESWHDTQANSVWEKYLCTGVYPYL